MELHCRCGKVRGEADFRHKSRVHVICHCGDCATYARHLGRDDAIEIVQTTPSQIRITEGIEHVRCLRLREKGLTRWFTSCCKSPLANTMSKPRIPFVGLMRSMLVTEDESLLGPKAHANGGQRTPFAVVFRSAWFLLVGFLRGRHTPSPFFDQSGALIAQPEVLTCK